MTIVTSSRKTVGRTAWRGIGASGRRHTAFHVLGLLALLSASASWKAEAESLSRAIPHTLPSHPGNIFLAAEKIIVSAPPGEGENWRVVDYENQAVTRGIFSDGRAEIGSLPVGWYKLVRGGRGYVTNRAFFCVIEPLRAPTPLTSPICIDVAMAWIYPKGNMRDVVNLCQLAGINRVRDRLNWQHMEPKRGEFAGSNQYDDSAEIQHAGGLQILQVNHLSPSWANPLGNRFPPDLRDAYRFYREMARRWKGQIHAFEPWNEADLAVFGGHTGSEIATFQKAAYLGLKAGNPDVITCQNVLGIRRPATLKDFRANEAWTYFDTYNLHTYEPLQNHPSVYADHRAISAGKPMWVTETSVHVKWRGDERLKELGDDDLRLQSERLTKTYALALHEDAQAVFYFMLPHYTERQLQYGLLRPDLTPRPGYVALAAVGRLLADAKPLGRIKSDDPRVEGHLFNARPEGKSSDVLVIWAENAATFELPALPKACFDHLGRARRVTNTLLNLTPAPLYAVLADGARPAVVPPPVAPKLLAGEPGEIVIQAGLPQDDTVLDKSAYKIAPGRKKAFPLFLYNFGRSKVRGRLSWTVPPEWKARCAAPVELAPGERMELPFELSSPENLSEEAAIRIEGDFGGASPAVLSLRFVPAPE